MLDGGHSKPIRCVSECLSGQIATGADDNTIRIWFYKAANKQTKQKERFEVNLKLCGHSGAVLGLETNAEDLYSCSDDKTLRWWQMTMTRKAPQSGVTKIEEDVYIVSCKKVFKGHKAAVHCCKMIAGQLVSGSKDKTIRMWNSSGNCDRVIDAHNLGVRNISTLRDGRLLSASEDGSVKSWQKGFDKIPTADQRPERWRQLADLAAIQVPVPQLATLIKGAALEHLLAICTRAYEHDVSCLFSSIVYYVHSIECNDLSVHDHNKGYYHPSPDPHCRPAPRTMETAC